MEHRVADPRILRLIRKWLKAGVMEEGQWSEPQTGTPQGSVVSPLLANVYLHYSFDLWANVWRQKWAQGEVVVIRYADETPPTCRPSLTCPTPSPKISAKRSARRFLITASSKGSGAAEWAWSTRSRNRRFHRFVALKFSSDEIVRDPQSLTRFQREVQAASALNHSSIWSNRGPTRERSGCRSVAR